MDVLNMNPFPVHPRIIKDETGEIDSINVMAKRRVEVPVGYSVDMNWLAGMEKVTVFANRTSTTPINTKAVAAAGVVNVAVGGSKR